MIRCTWKDETPPDANGWRKVRCVRCRQPGVSPYPHAKIIGECKAWPWLSELGYWLAIVLAAVGITKGRWNRLRRWLWLTTPCGCDGRIGRLNALGDWLAATWRAIWEGRT